MMIRRLDDLDHPRDIGVTALMIEALKHGLPDFVRTVIELGMDENGNILNTLAFPRIDDTGRRYIGMLLDGGLKMKDRKSTRLNSSHWE